MTTTHIRLNVTGVKGETGEPFVRELDRVEGDDHVQAGLCHGTSTYGPHQQRGSNRYHRIVPRCCSAHLGHGIRSHRPETLLDSPRQGRYPTADEDDLLVLSLA